nr:unnamed protein product [Callosobruchus analis]
MSEDGMSDGFEEPIMEIQIKTLMGTTFDMKISSMDTIEDIKKKIYRIEGIPIYQQSLIFQSRELKDNIRLGDAGIQQGSTLTLITLMRGGPISTRRLSVACEHHVMLKELKEILENTREEISPGSKVSVLVFKEGDMINLLRVIENEDGSYSPYSEKPISPPAKPLRKESRMGIFEKLVEDNEMSNKLANLRQKMDEVHIRKMNNSKKNVNKSSAYDEETFNGSNCSSSSSSSGASCSSSKSNNSNLLAFKFLSQCDTDLLDNVDLKIFEREENEEEIALKDKHRSNLHKLAKTKMKSLYSESKGAYSHTKQNYARMHKKSREMHGISKTTASAATEEDDDHKGTDSGLGAAFEDDGAFGETTVAGAASASTAAANRIHLARLVFAEAAADRPSGSPNSIELEENAQEVWEIHESAGDRLKRSATCKLGLLKRRQSLEYGFEAGIENPAEAAAACEGGGEFGVCSGNLYHHRVPQLAGATGTTAGGCGGGGGGRGRGSSSQEHHAAGLCDYYFAKQERSPLYGRGGGKGESEKDERSGGEEESSSNISSFLSDCSGIQRLKNDSATDCDGIFSVHDQNIDELYGYYNLGCSADLLGERLLDTPVKREKKLEELPPVIKKKARCNECNKRLNITNIYDCRCGKIFCSQHRYSEVHRCSYDYKLEGRKILEKQNPLVTADKISRI